MSSERSKRTLKSFDYRVYSETGKKVAKEKRELKKITKDFENLANMANEQLIDEEKKTCLKINRCFDEYDLDILFDIEEVEKGILEMKFVLENYESIHVELKSELNVDYEGMYEVMGRRLG